MDTCSNCSGPMPTQGRRPTVPGPRFCSKRACRSAYARHWRRQKATPAEELPPPEHCAHCGAEVARGGRPSATGRRFCTRRPCQATRQREYLDRKLGRRGADDRNCFHCGDQMVSRPWRETGLAKYGRWCMKPKCQTDRKNRGALIRRIAVNDIHDITFQLEMTALYRSQYLAQRASCPECGVEGAVPGYAHRDGGGGRCAGVVDSHSESFPVAPGDVDFAWTNFPETWPTGPVYPDREG